MSHPRRLAKPALSPYLAPALRGENPLPDLLTRIQPGLSDRYGIERELGRGGMATVFLARDLRHQRPVAIKVLSPELGLVLGRERFLREIHTCAQLHHPHILPLYDSGAVEDLLYFVMPYIEGESLRDRLARERHLPLDDALAITAQVADALTYAHSQGVLHRDIKPDNILLQSGHAFLSDFGIARPMDAGGERLTQTGLAIGTPAYMSPEQAAGEAPLDMRTDVYSLACVLYEMLAGEPPYTGPSAQAIQARRLTEPVRSIRAVRDNIPAVVERAVVRGLARVPADRWRTPAEFAAALDSAGPQGPSHRFWTGGRRGVALIATALAVTAVGGFLVQRSARDREERPNASTAPRDADPQALRAYVLGQGQLRRRTQEGLTNAVALFRQAIARDSGFARGWAGLASALQWARSWKYAVPGVPAESLLARALEASDRAISFDSADAAIWILRAQVAGAIDPTAAGPSLHALRRAVALDSLHPEGWASLGMKLEEAGDGDGAERAMRRAVALGWNPVDLAQHYYWWRQLDSAAAWADSAVILDPRLPWAHETVGAVALAQGRPAEAEAAYQAARRLDTGPSAVRSIAGLAAVATHGGDTSRARALIGEAEAFADRESPGGEEAIALAAARAGLGDSTRALDWLERVQPRQALHFQLHLKRDPELDPLRGLPRFRALLTP